MSPRRFIHNSYYGIWLWGGLFGVLAFAWLGFRTVKAIAAALSQLPAEEAGRSLAAGLAVLALGMQATFQTSLTSRPVIATLACALTLLDAPGLVHRRPRPA